MRLEARLDGLPKLCLSDIRQLIYTRNNLDHNQEMILLRTLSHNIFLDHLDEPGDDFIFDQTFQHRCLASKQLNATACFLH